MKAARETQQHAMTLCVFPMQDQRIYEQLRESLSRWPGPKPPPTSSSSALTAFIHDTQTQCCFFAFVNKSVSGHEWQTHLACCRYQRYWSVECSISSSPPSHFILLFITQIVSVHFATCIPQGSATVTVSDHRAECTRTNRGGADTGLYYSLVELCVMLRLVSQLPLVSYEVTWNMQTTVPHRLFCPDVIPQSATMLGLLNWSDNQHPGTGDQPHVS